MGSCYLPWVLCTLCVTYLNLHYWQTCNIVDQECWQCCVWWTIVHDKLLFYFCDSNSQHKGLTKTLWGAQKEDQTWNKLWNKHWEDYLINIFFWVFSICNTFMDLHCFVWLHVIRKLTIPIDVDHVLKMFFWGDICHL
jgi:hypothetical protein